MSSRLKSLGFGSKRKSNANLPTTSTPPATSGSPAQTPNGSTSTTNTPPANASQTSLTPMNSNPGGLGRPPSYQYSGRPQSPLPPPGQQLASHHPPPIDTTRGYVGANPQMAQQPPGYGGAGYGQMAPAHPQPMGGYGQHMRPAEVEGGNRSKAQLIVGIDFVCFPDCGPKRWTDNDLGNYILRCCFCICNKYGSERGYHH